VCREEEGAAEALDLKRPLGLGFDAPPEAVPPDEGERPYHRHHNAGERGQRTGELTHADREAEDREAGDGIDLRREGEPK
jgi:hypothetical protein